MSNFTKQSKCYLEVKDVFKHNSYLKFDNSQLQYCFKVRGKYLNTFLSECKGVDVSELLFNQKNNYNICKTLCKIISNYNNIKIKI